MAVPREVQEYFSNGRKRIVRITAGDDYTLLLEYDNNEQRMYDLNDMLTGVLAVLKDKDKFNEVFIDAFGNIAWDIDKNIDSNVIFSNRIDLSADNAYIYGKRLQAR
ncbi:MAG: DUF2442 domain-containing protein [Defluviitaleaceae bacterium]|nr:DUF2442 domain-containing protein [Defluviitaleaceae bacterium]